MTVGSGSLESLRELNRLRVVDALRRHGTLSRADIARVTGLSRSTISTLVADLQDHGFIIEIADDEPPRTLGQGRPPVLLRLDPSAGIAVGVDFDQTHVRVAVSALSRPLVDEAGVDAGRVLGVGVALAGPVDQAHSRLYDSSILADWQGVDTEAELRARLGVPVHIDNDANLGALAEVTLGA